jgi:hypothetical protein
MMTSDRQLPVRASNACAALRVTAECTELEPAALVQRVHEALVWPICFADAAMSAQVGAHRVVEREHSAASGARPAPERRRRWNNGWPAARGARRAAQREREHHRQQGPAFRAASVRDFVGAFMGT